MISITFCDIKALSEVIENLHIHQKRRKKSDCRWFQFHFTHTRFKLRNKTSSKSPQKCVHFKSSISFFTPHLFLYTTIKLLNRFATLQNFNRVWNGGKFIAWINLNFIFISIFNHEILNTTSNLNSRVIFCCVHRWRRIEGGGGELLLCLLLFSSVFSHFKVFNSFFWCYDNCRYLSNFFLLIYTQN